MTKNTFLCADDSGTKEIITADSAERAAEAYVDGGDWGDSPHTIWVDVYVTELGATGGTVGPRERHTVTVDPTEPRCADAEHDWQSPHEIVGGLESHPGVRGNDRGGVIITECCMRCGCARVTDTRAQNPANGEGGLRSVRYEPGRFVDQIAESV